MLKPSLSILSFMAILVFSSPVLSQNDTGKKEIEVTVEVENGTKKTTVAIRSKDGATQEYQWQGEEMPDEIKQELDNLDIDMETVQKEGETTVIEQRIIQEQPESGSQKDIQVIIRTKDGETVKEWNTDEELPVEIQQKVENLETIHQGNSNSNKIVIRSGDGDERVFEWNGDEVPEDIREKLEAEDLKMITKVEAVNTPSNKAILGIAMAMTIEKNIANNEETSTERLEIAEVRTGSGAEKAGLKTGDELISVNGIEISEPQAVVEILENFKPGDIVPVGIKRDDLITVLNVTLSQAEPSETLKKKTIVIEKDIEKEPILNALEPANDLELEELKIHPNPADNMLNISFKGEKGPLTISISDMAGKSLLRKEWEEFDGYYRDEIDLQSYPKGTLIIQIEQNGKKHTEKVVRMQ